MRTLKTASLFDLPTGWLRRKGALFLLAPSLFATVQALGQAATVTTLNLSAVTVAPGTAVTLTATVTEGGAPVTSGLVTFCDATAVHCTDVHIIGTAQITLATGTAQLVIRPGIGTHSYKAVYAGTTARATSTSAPTTLVVTGTHATTTAIASTGVAGNYTLTASVTSTGSNVAPTGLASFLDTSDNGYSLAGANFSTFTPSVGFTNPANLTTEAGTEFVVTGDFNGDGFADLATADYTSNTVNIFLSNGDGTFTAEPPITVGSEPNWLAVGDFNQDGKLDIAVANNGGYPPTASLSILLGNGDGTFALSALPTQDFNGRSTVVAADFNNDGIPDLAASGGGDFVIIFLGNGDGTFTLLPASQYIPTGTYPDSMTVADFNGDGNLDLAIADFGSDGVTSPSITILLGNGDGTFTATPTSPETGFPFTYGIVAADFNGDGKPDLAVANENNISLTIFLGNGDGTFTAAPGNPATNENPTDETVADLNGDGIPDLIALSSSAAAAVFLGNGDGTFTKSAGSPFASGANDIAAGDLNGDGIPDLAVTTLANNTLHVALTQLSTTSRAVVTGISPAGTGTDQIQASYPGDANYEASTSPALGLQDELVATTLTLSAYPAGVQYPGVVELTALLQPSSVQTYATDGEMITFYNGSTVIGTAPLTGGETVINATPGVGTNNYSASYGGDEAFRPSTSTVTPYKGFPGDPPVSVGTTTTLNVSSGTVASGTVVALIASVNDGPTLVNPGQVNFCDATAVYCTGIHLLGTAQLTAAGTATIYLVPGVGYHSYNAVFVGTSSDAPSTSATQYLTVTGPAVASQTAITSAGGRGSYNLTGTVVETGPSATPPTGPVSFVDTSNNNSVLGTAPLGAGTVTLAFPQSFTGPTGVNPQTIATGDFNGDGFADLVFSNGNDNTLTVLLGTGNGTFTAAPLVEAGADPFSIAAGDFNGDGKLDLAVANVNDDTITILLGNGDGTFTATETDEVPGRPVSIAIGDFNGDGVQDLAIALSDINDVAILLGDGDGTFEPADAGVATGNTPSSVVVDDFNGDGKADLAVANINGNTVTILLGNGDGTFTAAASPTTGAEPYYITAGDFNADGKPDLAVANYAGGSLTILLGNGDGTFTAAASPATGSGPASVIVSDFDGDGKEDLAVANYFSSTVTILLGNGDGTFTPSATAISTPGQASFATAADFNGDGAPDLAIANSSTNSMNVLLNQRTQTTTALLAGIAIPGTGTHNVIASYAGDTSFNPSTSAPIALAAGANVLIQSTFPTSTLIPYGPLSVTVTVTGIGETTPAPTGSVFYFLDNLTTAIPVPGTLTNGSITFTLPEIAAGNHFIDFSYSGDANYAGTPNNTPPASLAIPFAVVQVSDTLSVVTTPNPVRTPNPIAITATITSPATGATGTVTFSDGTTALGQAPVTAAGTATLSPITLAVGAHSITAAYSGDTNFLASTAPAMNTVVEPLAVQLTAIAPALATAGASDTQITATGANFSAVSVVNFNGTPLATTFVSPTQLQAVIPAALLVNTANVTVTVTDVPSASASQPAAFSILPPVQVTFSGPPMTSPGEQPPLTFQLQQAFPVDLNGVMTLTFTPEAGSPDDPEVQFATGGRTFNFTLPANTTTTPAILLQAGTVSGSISVSLQLTSSGVNVTPAYITPIAIAIPPVAPTATSVSYSASGMTLTVLVSGYSSTRDMQQATFTFTPAAGVTLSANSITLPAATLFQTWYSDTDSAQYGSSFTYTQSFTLSAPASQITGVGVTLTNSQGTSPQVTSQ